MNNIESLSNSIYNSSEKDISDKKKFKLSDLTLFLKSKNYRYTGSKKEVIERVLWVCYSDKYPKPENIDLKSRGRPTKKTIHITDNDNGISNNNDINDKNINLNNYKLATSKIQLKKLKSKNLKKILESHNYRSIGRLDELVDRVWWLFHQDTEEKPKGIEKKQRGRPTFKQTYVVEFINDDSD